MRAAERALSGLDATATGFSGQMHGLVALGAEDDPLRPEWSAVYAGGYARFRELYPRLRAL